MTSTAHCTVSSSSSSSSSASSSSASSRSRSPNTDTDEQEQEQDQQDGEQEHEHGQHHTNTQHVQPQDRESRKKAEKQRRTVLNSLVGELAAMVPLVADSSRKIDKTGVLRLAAHHLRKEHVFGDRDQGHCHMDVGYEAVDTLLQLLGGLVIVCTVKGVIVVVSPNVRSYLGHCQLDLLGHSLYSLVHPEDIEVIRRNLTPTPGELACPTGTVAPLRRDFCVRFLKASPRGERPKYVSCRVDGSFRRADRAGVGSSESRIVRRQRVRRDRAAVGGGDDVVFVAVAKPLEEALGSERLLEAHKLEYWTRHLVDGRIVYCDQRISLVAGYMSEEVTGLSGFTFMHKEDVRWVVIALRQMYDDNKGYGESFYRLVSRNGRCMYLWTRGFLEVDETTKVAQSFACINTLIHCDDEGMKMITAMRKKYSVLMELENAETPPAEDLGKKEEEPEDVIEDPSQLEQVIMHLLTDLPAQSPGRSPSITSRSDSSPSRSPAPNDLTIIPPQLNAIKSAIVNGVNEVTRSGKRISTNEPRCVPKISKSDTRDPYRTGRE